MSDKKQHPKVKSVLHPRNKHRERYDLKALSTTCPELAQFVKLNDYGDESIDFFNPEAVKMLNKALLMHFYGIVEWEIPKGYLCSPIPGRADYIHYIADLLGENRKSIPKGKKVKCLDIGVGSNCVYPIIGSKEYGWTFIGSEIDPVAFESANNIITSNPDLVGKIEIRHQPNQHNIFYGIIKNGERIDVTICNPPFHSSIEEAQSGSMRKHKNLKGKRVDNPVLNFGGQNNELWCEGGEKKFIQNMIRQSKPFANQCLWFTTAVAKQTTLKSVYAALKGIGAKDVKTIEMGQGNKKSRIVAWTFLNKEEQANWFNPKKGNN